MMHMGDDFSRAPDFPQEEPKSKFLLEGCPDCTQDSMTVVVHAAPPRGVSTVFSNVN